MDVIPSPQAGFLHACVIFWKTPRANARVTLSQILSHVFLKASIIISSMWLCWELWACSSRSTRESGPSLSQAPKVKHVHSARPEPRYLVGKVPSVHVFENINKSHRCELIMKSQAAWVTKVGGVAWGLTVGHWEAEIGRNDLQFHWQKRRHESHPDIFIGCYMHTHVHPILHTVHVWIQWPPEMTQIHIHGPLEC